VTGFGPGTRPTVDADRALSESQNSPGGIDWKEYLSLDARDAYVLRHRVLTGARKPTTLSALGEHLGVSRERVRQLEAKVVDRVIEGAPPAILALAMGVRDAVGEITTECEVAAAATQMAERTGDATVSGDLDLRRDLLVHLAGPYVHRGGLWASEAASDQLDLSAARIRSLGHGDRADEIVAAIARMTGADEHMDMLQGVLGVRRLDGHFYGWWGTQTDKAYTVLKAADRPMEFFEVHEGVGLEASPRSLAQRLREDHRFMRRGKDTYGLREWGGEEYSGILDELEQAIERAGGRAELDELVDRFTVDFDVSANSVRSYATDRRFVRHPDGSIAMRGADDPEELPTAARPLGETAGAFLLDGVWNLRIPVDADVLRGSGRGIRRSIAVAAGLEPDLVLGFTFDDGVEVTFSWRGSQPAIGSVRGIAIAHACVMGDLLFLPLVGPEPRSTRMLEGRVRHAESGSRRLAAEMGIDPDSASATSDEPPLAVRLALGLTHGSDWHDVVDRLRSRGEEDLLDFVPAARL
jgi:hypothetical protein